MTRKQRIMNAIENKMYKNGGHWCKLNMKKGGALLLQRQNKTYFEDLRHEDFNVYNYINDNNKEIILENAQLREIADYMIKNY